MAMSVAVVAVTVAADVSKPVGHHRVHEQEAGSKWRAQLVRTASAAAARWNQTGVAKRPL